MHVEPRRPVADVELVELKAFVVRRVVAAAHLPQAGDAGADAFVDRVALAVFLDLRLHDRTIPVRVRYPDAQRFNPELLGKTAIRGKDGQLTPASALVVTSAENAESLGIEPLGRVVAWAASGIEPKMIMMAPVLGVQNVLKKAGWDMASVDLFELNEAFSAQALGVMGELGLVMEKVNVNGGAVALGHAIGNSGGRVLTTLLYEMRRRGVQRGVAALCLGGGNSVAMAVERV